MPETHTVVVASSGAFDAAPLVERLSTAGFGVLGPVSSGPAALTLAAQSPVSVAIVGSDFDGRGGGVDLAETLLSTWGVPSLLLHPEGCDAVGEWQAEDHVRQRLGEIVRTFAEPTRV